MPELRINLERICFIVVKARVFHTKVAPLGHDVGSNPADQGVEDDRPYVEILEDYTGEASEPENVGIEPDYEGVEPDEIPDPETLQDYVGDPTEEELRGAITALSEEEVIDLVALMHLGRDDDATLEDWDAIVTEVAESLEEPPDDYLLGTPLLAEYLEEGLAKFDLTCVGVVIGGE